MSNESFEEFYNKQVSCEQYALSYDSRDMEIIRNNYERSKVNMKEAWDHQQKKIQELEKQLKAQNEKIEKLENVLRMVEDNTLMPHKHNNLQDRLYCLSARATEVLLEINKTK